MKKLLFLLLLAFPAYAQNVIPIVNGNVTINPTTPSNSFKILVNQAVTVNIINPPGGFPPTVTILFQQDGTGHAVTYGTSIVNGATVLTTANAYTSTSFQFDGSTNTWYGLSGGGGGGGGGTVTGVTGTSPIVSSGGTAPAISCPTCGTGTVTSVTGTTNQIAVATGTTTPVLSLPSSLVLPNGAVGTTQTTGDNTTKVATDQFVIANAAPGVNAAPNQNLIYASPFCSAQPNCYPVVDDGQLVWDASATNGTSTITTTTSDHPFTCPGASFPCSSGGDVGKIAWTTNAAVNGYLSQTQSAVVCAQSTIATVNTAHSITLAASADCGTGTTLLFWGSDDTTNLATAWNAAVAACTTLQLPGGNSANFGPAMLLVQAAEFNTVNGGGGSGQNSTCSLGSEGNRRGIGVYGFGIQLTYIIPSPTFDFTSCTFGYTGKACFFTAYDGMNLANLMLFGTGVSAPAGASANYVSEWLPIAGVEGVTTGNGSWFNVTFMGWGAASTSGITACLLLNSGTNQNFNVNEDGCGNVGFLVSAIGTAGEPPMLAGGDAFDNYTANVQIPSGGALVSNGQRYCCTGTSSGSTGEMIDVEGGTLVTTGDIIGLNATGKIGILVNGGTVRLANDTIYMANHTQNYGIDCTGACNVYSTNTSYISQGTNSSDLNLTQTTSNFYDLGGNTFVCGSCYLNGSTGNVFGSASIAGTSAAAANITASTGWGTSGAAGNGISAVSGATNTIKFTITAAGTPTANPTITQTFATPFIQSPICTLQQVGGTGALPASIVNGTPTSGSGNTWTGSGAFTWTGTPVAASTYIFVMRCNN